MSVSLPSLPAKRALRRWRSGPGLTPAALGGAAPWLALALGGVAFWVWQAQRRQRAVHTSRATLPSAVPCTRPALPPPAARASTELHELPRSAAALTPERQRPERQRAASQEPAQPRYRVPLPSPWLERASVAIHLRQPRELVYIARELDAAGYAAAAGLLHNYSLLLMRPEADRRRIQLAVTRMLSVALAKPPDLGPRRRVQSLSPDALGTRAPTSRARPTPASTPEPHPTLTRVQEQPDALPLASQGRWRVAR